MRCWNCEFYSPLGCRVDRDGCQEPYGICTNQESEDYNEEVWENYGCDHFKPVKTSDATDNGGNHMGKQNNDQKIKYMDIKEFREKGYLQEVNRRFFHPLGLALEISIDAETGEEKLGGIWDYRDDPGGVVFGESVTSKPDFVRKAMFIAKELSRRTLERGFFIQPVPAPEWEDEDGKNSQD